MFNEKMVKLGRNRSVIRDLFEYGNELKKTIGTENVFDFTLGNPSVPTPEKVNETIISLIKTEPAPARVHFGGRRGKRKNRDCGLPAEALRSPRSLRPYLYDVRRGGGTCDHA